MYHGFIPTMLITQILSAVFQVYVDPEELVLISTTTSATNAFVPLAGQERGVNKVKIF